LPQQEQEEQQDE